MCQRYRYPSRLAVWLGIMVGAMLVSGCQRSDDEYRVITEEISHSDQSVALDETTTSLGSPHEEPARAESGVVSELAHKELATPALGTMESASSVAEDGLGKQTATEPNAETPSSTKENPVEERTAVSENVAGFINVEEELARQRRLKKLGLRESTAPAEPREPKLLVTEREFSKESTHNAWRISYDDLDLLKILNMEPVPLDAQDHLPVWLTQLEGQRVVLRGWMFPPSRSEGLKGFIFVRDNQVCCFGPSAKAYDKLTVRLKAGETTKYIQGRPFDVVGTFKLDSWIEDERDMKTGAYIEKLGMLYHLEDAVVLDHN